MADNSLTGPDVKRLIKLTKQGPLPFAYNPGGTKGDDYFAMHKTRKAEQLGQEAKKNGAGAKAAFGQAELNGKVLELRCVKVVPAMARTLKKFLKANKVTLNVRIMDENGTVLEEDIEDLPDDPDLMGDAAPAPDGATAQPDTQPTATETPAPEQADASDVVAGLKQLQPAIAAAPGPIADKLKAALAKTVEMIKAGDVDGARATFEKLKAAADKLAATPPAAEAAASPDPAPTSAPGDGRLKALAERAKALQAQIAGAQVPDDVRAKLMTALQNGVGSLKTNDFDGAATIFDKVAEALTRLGMAGDSIRNSKTKPETSVETPDNDEDGFDQRAHDLSDAIETLRTEMIAQFGLDIQVPLGERLDAAQADLDAGNYATAAPAMAYVQETMRLQDMVDAIAPDFARAASTGAVEDVQKMRILFDSAIELVPGPDHAKAWTYLQQVQDMIQDGAENHVDAFLRDIPEDVRPFAVSRLNWTAARTTMKGEMDKLRDEIAKAIQGDPEFQAIFDNIGALYDYLETLDLRLAEKLDDIVNADPGPERELRKSEARAVLEEYQGELATPFFQQVDTANGFTNVSVTSTAMDALGKIDQVLAA